MKALLWIIAAIAVAVGLAAVAVRSSAGYVQIVLPPYRVELSLVLVIVLLLTVFVLVYLCVNLVGAMLAMPRQVREYRAARRSRKARQALSESLVAYFSGRYARAEKAATNAMKLGEQPGVAALLAARAAHELRAPERRDTYLASLAEFTQDTSQFPDGDLLKVITEAELLLKERRAEEALAVLQALPQKHTAGLRLELRALQLTRDSEKSLAVIEQLEKRKVYDADQANELRRSALTDLLKRRATDIPALDEAWRKVSDVLRRDPRVAGAAAQGYIALKSGDRAVDIIERSLDQSWDGDLVALYAECADNNTVPRIERAERWLAAHPGDAGLLLTLGRLCAREKLWGKARNYLDASLSLERTYQAHLASAQLQEQLGDSEAAQKHYCESLSLALARLQHAPVLV